MREPRQPSRGDMKIIRVVQLIANGGYLLFLGASVVALLQEGVELSLLRAIPFVAFGFVLAGNVAYVWRVPSRKKGASDRRLVETF
jgi:hypothetical protein